MSRMPIALLFASVSAISSSALAATPVSIEGGTACEAAAVKAARVYAFNEQRECQCGPAAAYPGPGAISFEEIQKDGSYRVSLETGASYVVEVQVGSYFCVAVGVKKEGK